ncbi:hypothetical protein FT643_22705 [Ketobacter sp. MCCC 1A13808]|uniref:hypothetical protein n=1 Tax=Ketobacter sp. MCCC 1A13808 TaxID=2602738 RepID=UPI0012EBFB0A|nr:hypothetical protein [Ketobacter sp. MCCC 1A13808]MVF14949.1 hypothetical protein [Ketobacter sp. MCCC 1A13808]
MLRYFIVIAVTNLAFDLAVAEQNNEKDTGFPWELVIDRGKINGCIYNNRYYSNGSIVVKETLPRKCKIDSNRDGYWAQLEEDELKLYESSVRSQMKLEEEALTVGIEPLNKYEAAIVRFMRRSQE